MKVFTMSEKWQNAPLFYVLAEIRFNSIELMERYVPEFQEVLRKNGFPDFREEINENVNIRQVESGEHQVNTTQRKRWVFNDIDVRKGFILGQDRIMFHTTSYDTFPLFLDEMTKGIEQLNSLVGIDFIERAGVRYVDVILPKEDDKVEDYINQNLLGFNFSEGDRSHNIVESSAQIGGGTLVARAAVFENGLAFPPDLLPLVLKPENKFNIEDIKTNAQIDVDHFVERRFPFALSAIQKLLSDSHNIANDTFRSSITEYAAGIWK